MLTLRGIGKFVLTDQEGCDRAPRGMKARGLLVLLATSPDQSRTRGWLQAHLWSDRAPPQAAASLRQALSDIRRGFGPWREALVSDRDSIALDPALFALSLDDTAAGPVALSDREAFEDVDVQDRAFEEAIREIRARLDAMPASGPAAQTKLPSIRAVPEAGSMLAGRSAGSGRPRPPPARPLLLVSEMPGTDPVALPALWTLRDLVLTALREHGAIDVVAGMPQDAATGRHGASGLLALGLRSIHDGAGICLRADLEEVQGCRMLWSGQVLLPPGEDHDPTSPRLDGMAHRIIDEVLEGFSEAMAATAQQIAAVLSHRALNALFRLDKPSMLEADTLLQRGFELEPCGQYLAQRALLRNLASFQHRGFDFLPDQTSATRLLHQALRHSPANSLVQAIASQLEYINGLHGALPVRLARSSVETDPSNPFCWAFLSNALAPERSAEGYAAARRAVEIARNSPYRYFFEHFACMSAAVAGQYEVARQHAAMGLRLKPDFVSTRRYEVALTLHLGDSAGAKLAIEALRREEPDFTPAMMRDPAYPVFTMHKLPLIDAVR